MGGLTWEAVSLTAPWSARHSFGCARLPGGARTGRLYILGGNDGQSQHDVWVSDDDGSTWDLMRFTHTHEMRYRNYEERASWTPRFQMCTVTSNDGLVTITGG